MVLKSLSVALADSKSTPSNSDGAGGWVFLIVVGIVVAVLAALFAKVRCKRCGYRGYKSEFTEGRCPQCKSLEYE
jgi:hypothetical protein